MGTERIELPAGGVSELALSANSREGNAIGNR